MSPWLAGSTRYGCAKSTPPRLEPVPTTFPATTAMGGLDDRRQAPDDPDVRTMAGRRLVAHTDRYTRSRTLVERPVASQRSLRMDTPLLLRSMTDAYVARRRKGGEFDDIAAIQAFWECEPQMSTAQTLAFADRGDGNSVAGWKIVLRGQLAASGLGPPRQAAKHR
jgi:hypothetical protein